MIRDPCRLVPPVSTMLLPMQLHPRLEYLLTLTHFQLPQGKVIRSPCRLVPAVCLPCSFPLIFSPASICIDSYTHFQHPHGSVIRGPCRLEPAVCPPCCFPLFFPSSSILIDSYTLTASQGESDPRSMSPRARSVSTVLISIVSSPASRHPLTVTNLSPSQGR